MRNAVLFTVATCIHFGLTAQPAKVLNAYNYMTDNDMIKAKAEIDPAIEHEKTKLDAKTWYYRGMIYEYLYSNSFIVNEKTKDLLYPQYVPFREGAVKTAIESYEKALSIGSNKIDMNEVKKHHFEMSKLCYQEGIEKYNQKDFNAAADYFARSFYVREQYKGPDGKGADLESAYNAALSYRLGKNYSKSEEFLRIALANNFKSQESMLELIKVYEEQGNKEKYKEALAEARRMFPDNQEVITAEINVYLEAKEFDKALSNLNLAIQNDATNPILYYVRGNIYTHKYNENSTAADAQKTYEQSEADFKKACELKPDYFDAYYGLGALYFNKGAETLKAANDIKDDAKYKAAKKLGEEQLNSALAPLEKAYELNPNDVATMTSLKELYARSNQEEKYNAIKNKLGN